MSHALFVLMLPLFLAFGSCKTDLCENLSCSNNGTCDEGICDCEFPWEGPLCNVAATYKFKGSYDGNTLCGPFGSAMTVVVNDAAGEPKKIFFEMDGEEIYGNLVSATTFDIPDQLYVEPSTGTTVNMSGDGSFSGTDNNMVTINMEYSVSGFPFNCTFTGTR